MIIHILNVIRKNAVALELLTSATETLKNEKLQAKIQKNKAKYTTFVPNTKDVKEKEIEKSVRSLDVKIEKMDILPENSVSVFLSKRDSAVCAAQNLLTISPPPLSLTLSLTTSLTSSFPRSLSSHSLPSVNSDQEKAVGDDMDDYLPNATLKFNDKHKNRGKELHGDTNLIKHTNTNDSYNDINTNQNKDDVIEDSTKSTSSTHDTMKNVPENVLPEKRSSRIRVPKRMYEDEYAPEERSENVDMEGANNILADRSDGDGVGSMGGRGVDESMDVDVCKSENEDGSAEESEGARAVTLPTELTPGPDPSSYLSCVVYSMSSEEAFYSCCLDQV